MKLSDSEKGSWPPITLPPTATTTRPTLGNMVIESGFLTVHKTKLLLGNSVMKSKTMHKSMRCSL